MLIEYIPKPINIRDYDWSACVGSIYGFGATREAAIKSLELLLQNAEENSRQDPSDRA